MAEIFSPPEEIKLPELDFKNYQGYRANCDKYRADLKAFLLNINKGKNVGEIIAFPVADGHAEYMVLSMKPLRLVHIPLGDAWEFQYVDRLTSKDVQEKIDEQKAIEKLFPPRKK